MAHHKRKGPKSTRAGCLCCKPHKAQYNKHSKWAQTEQEKASIDSMADELDELMDLEEEYGE